MGIIKSLYECFTGRDFAQYARDQGYNVVRDNPRNFNRIDGTKGSITLKDSDKTMTKPERNWAISMMIKIGIVMIPLALLGGAAYVLSALTGAPLF